jgi:DNA primase
MKITLEWLMARPFEIVGNGRESRFDCPNCDDTTKHLYVNADRSLWYCFKCGQGGKVQYQKLEPTLENFANLKYKGQDATNLVNKPAVVKSLPFNTSLPYVEIPEDCESGEELTARKYLHSRGVTQDEISVYGISISLEKSGPYRNSIIFPVYSNGPTNVLDYFVCRKYDSSKPKYVNAPWPKGDTLFITDVNIRKTIPVAIIVEGILDALAIARVGYIGIALLGKTATSQQLNRLVNLNYFSIVYLDNDALSQAIQLKLQLDTLGNKGSLIRSDMDAADAYLESPEGLKKVIEYARKH